MSDIYNRDEFIVDWARVLKCEPNAWSIAVKLINENKNYQTAMACCFGLSWVNHKEYLLRATKYFEANWTINDTATVEWLGAFVEHYITEVEKYPEDAS